MECYYDNMAEAIDETSKFYEKKVNQNRLKIFEKFTEKLNDKQ